MNTQSTEGLNSLRDGEEINLAKFTDLGDHRRSSWSNMMCNRYASNRQHRRRPIAGSSDCLPVTYQARTRCTNGVPANSSDSLILSTAVDRVHFQHSLLVGVAQSSVQEVDYHQLVIDIEPNFVLGEFFWQIYVCLFHLILEDNLRGIDTTSKNTGKTESTRNSLLIQHLNDVHPGRL